jgi:hypothetical protein
MTVEIPSTTDVHLVKENSNISIISTNSYWKQTGTIQPRLLKEQRNKNSPKGLSEELISLTNKVGNKPIPLAIITGIHTLCEGGSYGKSILLLCFEEAFKTIVDSLFQIDESGVRILKLKTCLNLLRIFRISEKRMLRMIAEHCVLVLRESSLSEELYFSGLLMAAACRNYGPVEEWIGTFESKISDKSIIDNPLMIFSNHTVCVIGPYSSICLIRGLILSTFDKGVMETMFESTTPGGHPSQNCLLSLIYLSALQVIRSNGAPPDHTILAAEIMINSLRTFRKLEKDENGNKAFIFSSTGRNIEEASMDLLDIVVTRWENVYRINELFVEFLEIVDSDVMERIIVRVQGISWTRMFKYDMIRAMLKKFDGCAMVIRRFPEVIGKCYFMMRSVEGRKASGLLVDLLKLHAKENVCYFS